MEIVILDRLSARDYEPKNNKTSIIRIYESSGDILSLKHDSKFKNVFTYRFDDIDVDIKNNVSEKLYGISPDCAKQIIEDFKNIKDNTDTLIVHCMAGISRSPAIAFALNEIFNLESLDKNDFFDGKKYGNYNRYVYSMMLRTIYGNMI